MNAILDNPNKGGKYIKPLKPYLSNTLLAIVAVAAIAGSAYYLSLPKCIYPTSPNCPHPPKRNEKIVDLPDGSEAITCVRCRD